MSEIVDLESIRTILTLRYNPNSKSRLQKIRFNDFVEKSNNNYVSVTENLLKNSISQSIQELSAKKIVLALSGGIDSVLVLTLMRELFPDLKILCISAGFQENDDEVNAAKEMARHQNCDFKQLRMDNFLNNLPQQIAIVREPKWHYYWYFLAQESKKSSSVLFTGDGGDELFGGYVFRYKKFLDLTNVKSTPTEKIQTYLNCHNRDWVVDQEKIFGKKIKFSWENICQYFQPFFDNSLNSLEQVFLADYNGKLMYDWIPALDKIHSHFKITSVAPILESKIIDFSCAISPEDKYDYKTDQGKLILRKILEKKKIGINNSKKGFTPNLIEFWKTFGNELVQTYLQDPHVSKQQYINHSWINNSLEKINATNDIRYINKILSVLSFEIWFRLFVIKDIKPHDKLL